MFLVALLLVRHSIIYLRAKACHSGRIPIRPGEWGILRGMLALLVFGILLLAPVKPF